MTPDAKALQTLLDSLGSEATIALCAHTRPDGDAIGSVAALYTALKAAGFAVTPLLADDAALPQAYRWLEQAPAFVSVSTLDPSTLFDLFIALDTPEPARLGLSADLCRQARSSVLIDHHPAQKSFTGLALIDESAAATGLLVWELVGELGLERNVEVASACYVALLSDTGSFQFNNPDARALRAASEMVEAGSDPAHIARELFAQKPLAALKLDQMILRRIRLENEGAVVTAHYNSADLRRLGVSSDWTENLIDLIRVVQGTRVAVLLVEGKEGGRVSLRSDGSFDVAALARRFGGGGHRCAAGITWPVRSERSEKILAQLLPLLPTGKNA